MALLARIANCLKPPEMDKIKIIAAYVITAKWGVANLGCTVERNFGNKPSFAPANNNLGVAITSPLTAPKQEMAAVIKSIVAPIGPTISFATAASGAALKFIIDDPSVPCVTTCS